jgi:hypothetical protein
MKQTLQILLEVEPSLPAISFIILAYYLIISLGVTENAWFAVLSGTIGGIIIGLVTEYYTGGAPVRKIAEQGQTGSATCYYHWFINWPSICCHSYTNSCCNNFLIKSFCWIVWCWNSCSWYVGYGRNYHGY